MLVFNVLKNNRHKKVYVVKKCTVIPNHILSCLVLPLIQDYEKKKEQ